MLRALANGSVQKLGSLDNAARGSLKSSQHGKVEAILRSGEIGCPASSVHASVVGVGSIGAGDAALAGKVGHVGRAMIKFGAEGDELIGHVVVADRVIPSIEMIAAIGGEAGRARVVRSGRTRKCAPPPDVVCTGGRSTR